MEKGKLNEVMSHSMRCVSGRIFVSEMEKENKVQGLSIELKKIADIEQNIPIILNKTELHSFIGLLLHIQSKMK